MDLTHSRRGETRGAVSTMLETAPPRPLGILPIVKSGASMGMENGWKLPGHGEASETCGKVRYRGCLNVSEHPGGLDRPAGQAYVEVYAMRCYKAECPICYESWAGREADRAEHRLRAYGRGGGVIHLMVSVPQTDWGLVHGKLRSRAYEVARSTGFRGGCSIFHPWREDEETGLWYLGPHFHMVGYGWISGAEGVHGRTGWVVKNLGLRKTVIGTLLYQLSHAGIHEGFHAVTWFGALAYGKLKVEPWEPEKPRCPLCKAELVPLLWTNEVDGLDPPSSLGDFFMDPRCWHGRVTMPVRRWAESCL